MQMLLSRGRPFFRKIVLGKGDPDEVSGGLVGNTILLAQPTPGAIHKQMPPPAETFCDGLSVIFTTAREDVSKAKPLYVSRRTYLECARLRQRVCYAFASAEISERAAEEALPEQGVPEIIIREAIHLQEARLFEPTMDGPGKVRDPTTKEQDPGSAEEEAEDEEPPDNTEAAHCPQGTGGMHAADASSTQDTHPEPVLAEELIGLDEANLDDPLSQVMVLQSRLRALQRGLCTCPAPAAPCIESRNKHGRRGRH